jgi:hypothetical protein
MLATFSTQELMYVIMVTFHFVLIIISTIIARIRAMMAGAANKSMRAHILTFFGGSPLSEDSFGGGEEIPLE